MTTRNERIVERIRKEFWDTRDNNPATRTPGAIAALMATVEQIDFSDVLGPEVTEEVMDDLRESWVTSQSFWRYARTHVRYAMADARRGDPWKTREQWAECWQRYRRLAKFMRALERSVK